MRYVLIDAIGLYHAFKYTPGLHLCIHVNPSVMNQVISISMMHECSLGHLLARATFTHHADKGQNVLYKKTELPSTVTAGRQTSDKQLAHTNSQKTLPIKDRKTAS